MSLLVCFSRQDGPNWVTAQRWMPTLPRAGELVGGICGPGWYKVSNVTWEEMLGDPQTVRPTVHLISE